MNIILHEASHHFTSQDFPLDSEISQYVLQHRFYNASLSVESIVTNFRKQRINRQREEIPQGRQQLKLYLRPDTNPQIFAIYEHILRHPSGVTYDELATKLHTDIINVSHFCCKLKKMRFINWVHRKDGIHVFVNSAGTAERPKFEEEEVEEYPFEKSFTLRELTLLENIWLNIASERSISGGGLTNQEIKSLVMKQAQNKMLRRSVQAMKGLERVADRQGKVFEYKYQKPTAQLKMELTKIEKKDILNEKIVSWLEDEFPELRGEDLLLRLINDRIKDYYSCMGTKQSKRQCTPVKLTRYIRILNYVHAYGPCKEQDLHTHIIEREASLGLGRIHKRSIMAILDGLCSVSILLLKEKYYYPAWQQDPFSIPIKADAPKDTLFEEPIIEKQKRIKATGQTFKYQLIDREVHRRQLQAKLIYLTLHKMLEKRQKDTWKNVLRVKRRKNIMDDYTPTVHILHLLQKPIVLQGYNRDSLPHFYEGLDALISANGRKESSLCVEYDLVKFVRKNVRKDSNSLQNKYGRSWMDKFSSLSPDIICIDQDGFQITPDYHGFLI